jgi:hypothetical protein
MTLVVGVNLGYYALVASDSRITWFEEDGSERVDDNAKKVIQTPIGLAAGSGLILVVDNVISELSARPDDLAQPAAVAQYMREFLGGFLSTATPRVQDERAKPLLDTVGWALSSVERRAVHVRLYHSSLNFKPIDAPVRRPATLLPIDVTRPQTDPLEAVLMSRLRRAKTAAAFEETLDANLRALVDFYKSVRRISEVLGPAIQVGCQTVDGEVELGDLMPLADFV